LEHHYISPPQPLPPLKVGEVHVWMAQLAQSSAVIETCRNILAADESERAARFKFDEDRQRFIVSRGLLRLIVSDYLHRPADQLAFHYSAHGKPAVVDQPDFSFNVSHSHGYVMVALTHQHSIGVDIERHRDDMTGTQIADRFFAKQECQQLRALPSAQHAEAFFATWTRKEAIIKALGEGLSFPLQDFVVSVAPQAPAKLLSMQGDSQRAAPWSLVDLPCPSGYRAALAMPAHIDNLLLWRWQSDVTF